jgi:hypothetical protein
MSVFGVEVKQRWVDRDCVNATDPITQEALQPRIFGRDTKAQDGRTCYTAASLAQFLNVRTGGKFNNADPLSRSAFTPAERGEVFRLANQKDKSGGLPREWSTYVSPNALYEAIESGDLQTVRDWMTQGDRAGVRKQGLTPLEYATRIDSAAARLLLEDGGAQRPGSAGRRTRPARLA